MKTSRIYTLAAAILTALVLLAGSIAVPILCRPFYYAHIDLLNLEESTGLTREEIKTAYDEMLDYCLGGSEFSTGVLAWSESGKSHFTDVRGLFLLDLRLLVVSAVLLAVLLVFARWKQLRPARLLKRGPTFWAGAGLGAVFLIVGGLAATDFDRAFVVFHTLFFPGKDNWIFDPDVDEIINILPERFFMDCAILILAVLVAGCAVLIAADLLLARRARKKEPAEV